MRWQALGTTIIGLAALVVATSCEAPVATDTSPGALDVKLIVLDLEPTPSDGKVIVGIQFFSSGNVVQVGTGVANCDGVNLTPNALLGNAYAERVPLRSPGQAYHFAYKHGSTTTTVDVPAPTRPTITSPSPNQPVARTATVSVTYPPGGGAAVIVGTSTTNGYTEHGEQQDNGTYSNVDMTAQPAGAGSVKLKRIFRSTFSGTAFKSAVGEVTTGSAHVSVVWT
jgi:hypothetical protein